MRRFFFGFIWFIVISFGGLAIGGAIVGASAAQRATKSSANPPQTFSEGYDVGHAGGEELGRRYGKYFFLGGLVLATAGSVYGILPGTKRTHPKPDTGV